LWVSSFVVDVAACFEVLALLLAGPPGALMQGGASSSSGAVSLGQQVRQMGAPASGGGGVGTPTGGSSGAGGGGSSGKRGRGRPMGANTPGNPSSAFKVADVTPAARRKKQKVVEKQIPDKVAALLPESAIYTQLVEFEARVDAALARKKLDIQEVVRSPPPVERILRMYVFNTFAHQSSNPNASFQQQQHFQESPTWTLRIMGRVLDPDEPEQTEGSSAKPANPSLPKFSSFFKRITIQLDPLHYPENSTIVWDSARATNHVEGFEIKRRGNVECDVSIRLEMDHNPERFKLSQPLAQLLGVEVDTRPHIIAALWQYIKTKKLQNPADPTLINCDPALQKVLGDERIKFASISTRLKDHLSPPQPIHLNHRIRLSGSLPAGNACYDVSVNIPAPLLKEMNQFLTNIEKHRDIDLYDDMIANTIRKINEHRRRRAYFLGFSHSPVDFINGLIASQSRDLKMVVGQNSRNTEKERRSDFYNQPWVEDAVIRYLNRRPAKASDGPGNNP
jgi:SWI/SNF-related matrix-associated actin-dependent regulator of chromatin subfamily D